MKILILGDVCGPAGRKIIKEKLPQLIKKKKIDFVILNGENAADPGVGITKKIVEDIKNKNFKISDISKKPATRNPDAPFSTSTLQQTAASIFSAPFGKYQVYLFQLLKAPKTTQNFHCLL